MKSEQHSDDSANLKIVLLGSTGSGKTATANVILGREAFLEASTTACEVQERDTEGQKIWVIDTPGLSESAEVKEEIQRSLSLGPPAPTVFLFLVDLTKNSDTECKHYLELIQKIFGTDVLMYAMVVFTRKEQLTNKMFEKRWSSEEIQALVRSCEGRHHSMNSKAEIEPSKMADLLNKTKTIRPLRPHLNQERHLTWLHGVICFGAITFIGLIVYKFIKPVGTAEAISVGSAKAAEGAVATEATKVTEVGKEIVIKAAAKVSELAVATRAKVAELTEIAAAKVAELASKAAEKATTKASELAVAARAKASEVTEITAAKAAELASKAAEKAAAKASELAVAARAKASEVTEITAAKAAELASKAAEKAAAKASELAVAAREKASEVTEITAAKAAELASKAAEKAAAKASELAVAAREKVAAEVTEITAAKASEAAGTKAAEVAEAAGTAGAEKAAELAGQAVSALGFGEVKVVETVKSGASKP